MVKLSNAEIDEIFNRSARPGVSGNGVISNGSSNTNLESNLYNVARDDAQIIKNKARRKTLARDQKINGAMSEGSGFKEFAEGFKQGFTGTMQTIGTPVLDVVSEIIPFSKVPRKIIKTITGVGEPQPKQSLKKELGITNGSTPNWSDYVKTIKDTSGLSFKDALKVASEMKRGGMYKMEDVTPQNIATIGHKVLQR